MEDEDEILASMGKCPRCGKCWYSGYPEAETPEEEERRVAWEQKHSVSWSGGCMDTGICRDCGVELVYEADEGPES